MKETKENFNNFVGKRLMEIRHQKEMTREQLAERADISAKYLYEVETGRKNCSLYIIYKISRCLNIDADFITKDENNKSYIWNDAYQQLQKDQKEQLKKIIRMICEIIDSV